MIHIANHKIKVDWGHLLVATLIFSTCVWYLFDARSTSLRISNLILVQPGVIIAVVLYLLILPQCILRIDTNAASADSLDEELNEKQHNQSPKELLRVASLATAFGLFVFSMDSIGFDIAAWLFVTVGLFVSGERRWWVLAIFPPVFTLLIVYGYSQLIPYPFPTLLL